MRYTPYHLVQIGTFGIKRSSCFQIVISTITTRATYIRGALGIVGLDLFLFFSFSKNILFFFSRYERLTDPGRRSRQALGITQSLHVRIFFTYEVVTIGFVHRKAIFLH